MDNPFVIEQVYDAAIDKVWQALTGKDNMKTWYFPQLKKFEPVVGFEFEFADDGQESKKE
jgi:uncharacterized protein YndB with AHSA1/START domain